ncbi:MAG: EAL domain-containing protein [Oscillospiraceae bacterium]|jgi:EAL domain-containing protein (putative c-di-GMP-specific phosphodiesterase class I)/GGDEF domain-containing protein|nr:EAL domain-containing protein [Oscillospiraceae bacterium]
MNDYIAVFVVALAAFVLGGYGTWLIGVFRRKKQAVSFGAPIFEDTHVAAFVWRGDFSYVTANAKANELLASLQMKGDTERFLREHFWQSGQTVAITSLCAVGTRVVSFHGRSLTLSTSIADSRNDKPLLLTFVTDAEDNDDSENELERKERYYRENTANHIKLLADIDIYTLSLTKDGDNWLVQMPFETKSALGFSEGNHLPLAAFSSRIVERYYTDIVAKIASVTSGEKDGFNMETELYVSRRGESRQFLLKAAALETPFTTPEEISFLLIDTEYQRERYSGMFGDVIDKETGLLNQKGFISGANAALAELSHATMLAVRINKLSQVQSLFGTGAAGQLLGCFSNAVTKTLHGRYVAGRMGYDTIGVLASFSSKDRVEEYAELLKDVIHEFCANTSVNSELINYIDFNVGACFRSLDGSDDVPTFYSSASVMLYIGDSREEQLCRFYEENIEREFYEREKTAKEITVALRENEYMLWFQPKINFDTWKMFAVEALIRWKHPTRGLLFPAAFLPEAQHCGMLARIDRWSLKSAFLQAKAWEKKGFSRLRVSINLSVDFLLQRGFFDIVKHTLDETGVRPEMIEFEIAETFIEGNLEGLKGVLSRVKELGITLVFDNFGAGYNSYHILEELPFDHLKIDRSLTSGIVANSEALEKIVSINETAKAFDITVLCEGIETEEQADLLCDLGVKDFQGYYCGKPMTAAMIEKNFLKI